MDDKVECRWSIRAGAGLGHDFPTLCLIYRAYRTVHDPFHVWTWIVLALDCINRPDSLTLPLFFSCSAICLTAFDILGHPIGNLQMLTTIGGDREAQYFIFVLRGRFFSFYIYGKIYETIFLKLSSFRRIFSFTGKVVFVFSHS